MGDIFDAYFLWVVFYIGAVATEIARRGSSYMKIIIAYPPLKPDKGVPLLSQNRQFQYFKEPTYIYPVVPAQAATMLKTAGHEVVWLDAIASQMSYKYFLEQVKREEPDLIAFETKTPVVKQHWKIIDDLKKLFLPADKAGTTKKQLSTVLFGDHVTALPQESFENSSVDFVLTGGDYDFLLLNLCNSIDSKKFEPGIWYREGASIKNSGPFKLNHDLNTIPFIDRDLTQWRLYAYKNGNFKKTPGTYIMSGRDCWWGKCTFCSWGSFYPEFRSRKPGQVLDEIGMLVAKYGIKEIMDDTGTFPVGEWLVEFCQGMVSRGLNKKVALNCNMRFGALTFDQYKKMKKAGFRLVLFGLESANQKTLDRINKKVTVDEITESCKMARCAGLYPHITIMFGYPWETYEEALETLNLGRWLLKKGFAYTVQATIVIPYPGSPLFAECQKDGLLKTLNWDDYDMKTPVMRSPISDVQMAALVQGIYKVAFSPEFIVRRLISVRHLSDLTYFKRCFQKVAGHIFDFKCVREEG
jgi:radical SAM superfamily enzyme YgiQ (UPF0313 family)